MPRMSNRTERAPRCAQSLRQKIYRVFYGCANSIPRVRWEFRQTVQRGPQLDMRPRFRICQSDARRVGSPLGYSSVGSTSSCPVLVASDLSGLRRKVHRRRETQPGGCTRGAAALLWGEPRAGGAPDPRLDHRPTPDSLFAEPKPCGIKTIVSSGRSGHLAQGGHIGGGLRVCRFGVTETPVGGFANNTKGIPVLRTDAAPDVEVTGITDDRLGTQRPYTWSKIGSPVAAPPGVPPTPRRTRPRAGGPIASTTPAVGRPFNVIPRRSP